MRGCPSYPASKLQAKALIDFSTPPEKAVGLGLPYESCRTGAGRRRWQG
jgi:hypothetical protein